MRFSQERLIEHLKLGANTFEEETLALGPDGHPVTIKLKSPPPVTEAELLEAEAKLGFRLPPLMRRCYLEVSNGWFGPGAGLWKLDGPWPIDPFDDENISLVSRWRDEHSEPATVVLPDHLLQICDWGCAIYSHVDCSQPEGPVWLNDNNRSHCIYALEAPSLHEWLESWLEGEMSSPFDWEHARKVTFECHAPGSEYGACWCQDASDG